MSDYATLLQAAKAKIASVIQDEEELARLKDLAGKSCRALHQDLLNLKLDKLAQSELLELVGAFFVEAGLLTDAKQALARPGQIPPSGPQLAQIGIGGSTVKPVYQVTIYRNTELKTVFAYLGTA